MRGLLALVGALVFAGPAGAAPALTVTQHHTVAGEEYVSIAGTGLDSVQAARCRHTITLGAATLTNSAAVSPGGAFAATTKHFKPAGPYGIAVACDDPGGSPTGSFAGTLTPIPAGDGAPVSLPFVAAQPTAPKISSPVAGTYVLGKQVDARYRCADALTCVGPVPSGSPIDTSTVGPHTFTVTATTGAGVTATATVTYRVVYPWNGFFAPVTNSEEQQLNTVRAGDLVRFKFWLDGDRGMGVFTNGSPKAVLVPCPYWSAHDVPAAGAGAEPGFEFGNGHYVYGLQTQPGWEGTCRRVEVSLDDGTTHSAVLRFPATSTIDLEPLTVATAQQQLAAGTITAKQLAQAYLDRIHALNTRGPGLNAVRILNPDALAEADASDTRRAAGQSLGPMDGVTVLLKDNIDVAGMPTTAGAVALEHSVAPVDSTVAANLKAAGAVILGKTNLSEFANFITNSNPSGYSGLGGQVLAAVDADLNPSGSSSGSATSAAAALALVTIGTETSGSIISPSAQQGDVGLRPTVGLVSRFGIVPISASQDTAGPIVRTVADAAAELQAIAGPDPKDHSPTLWGPGVDDSLIVPPQPSPVPNYLAALDPNALNGKRIGIINNSNANYQAAISAITALGATAVPISTPQQQPGTGGNLTTLLDYEFHRDLNNYFAHLGPTAPIHTLADVIAFNNANPLEAIKFGHTELVAAQAQNVDDLNSAQSVAYRTNLVSGKNGTRGPIDSALTTNSLDAIMTPSGTLTGIGARAGYPQLTVPAGYSATTRQPVNISFNGTAYSEAKLLAFGYAYEQATKLRKPASMIDPSMYRCADTVPAPPFASRGGCAPGPELLATVGTPPDLGFPLETTSAQRLEAKLAAGTLTSVQLTKAYLARIAMTNTSGPAINAVRSLNPSALAEAVASDALRASGHPRGPLEGLPVLVSDDVDVAGLPTTAGSIALRGSMPAGDSKLVANLRAAGAVILGKTNTTELSGWTSTSMPSGYSSLGGQVLDPSDADISPAGSSAGSAAAASAGLAALTIGTEASAVNNSVASIVSPAQANAVVGLKPTVGLVSRTGILPVSLTQETGGVLGQTVADVAAGLAGMAGPDAADPATTGQPSPLPDYLAGLSPTALAGKRIAVSNNTGANYLAAIQAVQAAGATTIVKTIPTAPSPNPPDIVTRELKRDVNAYLGALPVADPVHSLEGIIAYVTANPDEGLKYGMTTLTNANAIDLTDPATSAAYTSDRDTGLASNRALIDTILNNGTPADPTDDFDALLVQAGSTVGFADRAGYPVISVPAGYSLGNQKTFNPVNVSFVGTAYSEPRLLADAYAYEQATHLRQGPSTTNPSLWRCVPGSAFPPHSCAP